MTPSNPRISRALALLISAGAAALVAAPVGAQTLDSALGAQGEADRAAAASQKRINEIRDRTQDASSRYASAIALVAGRQQPPDSRGKCRRCIPRYFPGR